VLRLVGEVPRRAGLAPARAHRERDVRASERGVKPGVEVGDRLHVAEDVRVARRRALALAVALLERLDDDDPPDERRLRADHRQAREPSKRSMTAATAGTRAITGGDSARCTPRA
jgi:hypothetical protein